MSWYYSKNGQQQGPVSEQVLRAKFSSGEISRTDLVWKEGMSDWKPYSSVTELSMGGGSLVGSIEGNVMLPQPPQAGLGARLPMISPHIPSYLWQSIIATLFCCMPFGIVAIVYAAKVDSLLAVQDYLGAQSASDSAKIWVGVSVGIALLIYIPIIIVWMIGLSHLIH
jgi:hypothetical protein